MASGSLSPMIVTTPVAASRSTVAAALADAGSSTTPSAAITRQRRITLMGPSSSNRRRRCKLPPLHSHPCAGLPTEPVAGIVDGGDAHADAHDPPSAHAPSWEPERHGLPGSAG